MNTSIIDINNKDQMIVMTTSRISSDINNAIFLVYQLITVSFYDNELETIVIKRESK